jgi:hypothetical protein
MMFTQVLRTHWIWTRAVVLTVAAVAFSLPTLIWRLSTIGDEGGRSASAIIAAFGSVGPVIAFFSILAGFLLAAYPWSVENETRHVYPLSLPVPWARYVSMRFGAGAVFLLVPTVTLWLGALLALSFVDIPAALRTYPGTLALRFLLATLFVYSATFALQYVAGKRAPIVALVLLLTVPLVLLGLEVLAYDAISGQLLHLLTDWPSPLAIFSDAWRLIDV